MESLARHRCLIYEGSPSRHLSALASAAREKLQQNHRCLYLNSPSMVSGMRSCLAASGVDVAEETARGSLVLSSAQHLQDGFRFDVRHMIDILRSAIDRALHDGYSGLWATGDMGWEFGPMKDFSRLLEYEWHLEELLRTNPEMSGICQYRADMLPRVAARHGILAHRTVFVDETLSFINPQYLRPERFTSEAGESVELDNFINQLLAQEHVN